MKLYIRVGDVEIKYEEIVDSTYISRLAEESRQRSSEPHEFAKSDQLVKVIKELIAAACQADKPIN
jgi:hypothetical protein